MFFQSWTCQNLVKFPRNFVRFWVKTIIWSLNTQNLNGQFKWCVKDVSKWGMFVKDVCDAWTPFVVQNEYTIKQFQCFFHSKFSSSCSVDIQAQTSFTNSFLMNIMSLSFEFFLKLFQFATNWESFNQNRAVSDDYQSQFIKT